ncbi:MAG: T9SS type A sorting domain-containing protein [Dysgonamonadaceae bacterium]|jgi:hypothetical protein|nr:T9SS type A sorting domain-containing protein [Dysgonamonadaceae bacterium]
MKRKIIFLMFLLLNTYIISPCFSQNETKIDSITINEYTNDSIEFNLFVSFLGQYNQDFIEYQETNDRIVATIYFNEFYLHADCYCQSQSTFKIKRDKYKQVHVVVKYRLCIGGDEQNPVYDDEYMTIDTIYSLSNSGIPTLIREPEKESNFIHSNFVSDKLVICVQEDTFVNIYSLSGNLLIQKKIGNNEIVDISQLSKGLYIVKIGSITNKIIKN